MIRELLLKLPVAMEQVRDEDIVFDLDGTLIIGDLGETVFYHYLLEPSMESILPDDKSDLMNGPRECGRICRGKVAETMMQYDAFLADGQHKQAYMLAARWLGKKTVDHIRKYIWDVLEAGEYPVKIICHLETSEHKVVHRVVSVGAKLRPGMNELVSQLQLNGARIWIVSASPQSVVEAFADWAGIPCRRILAVETTANGSELLRFPWGRAKADALRQAGVNHPLIAFGDTLGDSDMLAMASYPIVMADGDPALIAEARSRNWFVAGWFGP